MASSYPAALDNFSITRADATAMATTHAADHDNANDAINKIEAELGTLPKGSFVSVKARLDGDRILPPFGRSGVLAVAVGASRFMFPQAVTITGIRATVGTAPVGSSILVDVNKNGATIFTTQANRPAIAAAANASGIATPDITAYAAGDYMTVDVDQIGSTTPGSDLLVIISYKVT